MGEQKHFIFAFTESVCNGRGKFFKMHAKLQLWWVLSMKEVQGVLRKTD